MSLTKQIGNTQCLTVCFDEQTIKLQPTKSPCKLLLIWLYKKQTFTSSVFIPAKVFTNSLNFSLFNFWAVEEKYKYHKKSFFER